MPTNQDKVTIKIESTTDPKAIDQTITKVKSLSGQANAATKATSSFRKAMSGLNQAMGAFGAMAIISKIVEIAKAFDEARRANEMLIESIKADNAAAGINSLKRAYDQLRESIQQANDEATKTEANFDALLNADRRLADAQLNRREAEEIASLDTADPEHAQKATAIRARYALTRAQTGEDRATADADLQAQRNQADIERRQAAIAQMEAEQAGFITAAGQYQQRAAGASAISQAASNKRNIFGMKGKTWWGQERSEIKAYAGYAATGMQQSSAALQSAAQIQRQIEAERQSISGLQAQQPILEAQRRATAAETSTTTYTASHATTTAQQAVIAARTKREQEQRDAQAKIAAQAAQVAQIQARQAEIQAEQDRRNQAAAQAYQDHQAAQAAQAAYRPGITRSGGRIVTQDQLDTAAQETAQAATRLHSEAESYLRESSAELNKLTQLFAKLNARQSTSTTGAVNLD